MRRTWSRGGKVPRAGISEPRERQRPRSLVPSRPNVKEPVVWSWAVQQIVSAAAYIALHEIAQERYGRTKGMELLSAHNKTEDDVQNDPEVKREYYDRTIHFVAKVRPSDGFSEKGSAVDRAEARLRLWLDLFA
jgi:hypothetical protein